MKSLEREYEALQQDSDMKKLCGDSLLRNVENFAKNAPLLGLVVAIVFLPIYALKKLKKK
ncbi:hypothetical protein BAMA_05640 [Bacillus manliponensis]|uniref:Uncharacterized protein n=1 Tax=Bacillus manliponensis TaxID=574376 RepID=A0A073JTY5_9BACI|nr:hypothetical protein [Bacillus manliponensis]KEK18499.1 hypothetical protein BAMA_05640 [Bacillus manliponensis]